MRAKPAKIFAWFVCFITACQFLFGLGFSILYQSGAGLVDVLIQSILGFLFLVIGLLVATRQPRNPIGWFLLAGSFFTTLTFIAISYNGYALASDASPISMFFAWVAGWGGNFGFSFWLLFTILYFPNGRLPSSRWRPVLILAISIVLFRTFVDMVNPSLVLWFPPFGKIVNIDTERVRMIQGAISGAVIILSFIALISVIIRFQSGSTTERQQIKWVFYAAILGLVLTMIGVLGALSGSATEAFYNLIFATFLFSIPITMGIAILRYRLWDIDLIIRRTLVYTILTGLLGVVYFGSVTILQQIIFAMTGSAGQPNIVIVLTTLLIAVLFNPLRLITQEFIDRRFYRRRYNVEETVQNFAATLRNEVDLESLGDNLKFVVKDTMQPKSIYLWIRKTK